MLHVFFSACLCVWCLFVGIFFARMSCSLFVVCFPVCMLSFFRGFCVRGVLDEGLRLACSVLVLFGLDWIGFGGKRPMTKGEVKVVVVVVIEVVALGRQGA